MVASDAIVEAVPAEPCFGTPSRIWTALRESVFPFDDPQLESALLTFIYAPTVAPHTVVLAIMAILLIFAQALTATNPSISDRPIDPQLVGLLVVGSIAAILAIVCGVCWRKGWWTEPHHVERWWVTIALVWQVGVNTTVNSQLRGFCDLGYAYESALSTNTTASRAECRSAVIDGWQLSTPATLMIGAPRVRWSALVILADVFTTFICRWSFGGVVDFRKGEGFRLFYFAFVLTLLSSRELLQRRRFLAHHALIKKMENSTKARHAVETIMANILPASIIARLVRQEQVADQCTASVLFSDIAGFTTWSSSRKALEIVQMLNSMYRRVDADVDNFGVDKITTIGDAYWAACGILTPMERHATRLCAFGLQMQRHVGALRRRQPAYNGVHIRVGVSSGEVTGGVVGMRQLAYQVFGPVNEEAEHMEQLAAMNTVLVSTATHDALRAEAGDDSQTGLVLTAGPSHGTFVVVHVPWSTPNEDHRSMAFEAPLLAPSSRASASASERLSSRQSSRSDVGQADRRAFLLGAQRRAVAAAATENSDHVDLVGLRRRLSESVHTLRLDFADPTTEEGYREFARNTYRSYAGSGMTAALNASFLFVAIIIMASESAAEPHSPVSFAVYSLLFVAAAACAVFAPHVPVYVSWFRLGLDCVAQIVVISIFMDRKVHWSMVSADILYLTMLYGLLFTHLGVPALSWLVGVAYGYAFFVLTEFVAYYLRGQLGIGITLNNTFGFGALFFVGLRRMESELRSQFLDERVAVVAEEQISAEKADLEAILARSVPAFVLPELVEWLSSDRRSAIAHQLQHASIMFVRVPAVAAQCADAHADADALSHVSRLVALYDETLVAADVSTVIKIKTIGDILLLAAGLHRHGRQPHPDESANGGGGTDERRTFLGTSLDEVAAVLPGVAASEIVYMPRVCAEDVRSLVLVGTRLQRAVHDALGHDIIAGVHMGAVVSGVLGDERLVYDCFSDVVNVASRIMSTSRAENGDAGVWVSELVAAVISALQMTEHVVVSDHTSHVRIAVHLTPSSEADDKPGATQLCGSVTLAAPSVRKMKGKGDVAVHKVAQATNGVQ